MPTRLPVRPPTAPPGRPPLLHWPVVAGAAGLAAILVVGMVVAAFTGTRLGSILAHRRSLEPPTPVPIYDPGPPPIEVPPPAPPAPPAPPEPLVLMGPPKPSPAEPPPAPPAPVEEPKPAEPALPASELLLGPVGDKSESYGTKVAFRDNPTEAAKQAAKEGKLLFVLHISGNFEDARFT